MISPLHTMLAAGGGFLEGYRAPLLTLVIALFVSWLSTPFVRKVAIQRGVMDDPTQDDRRIHTAPVPRWGGLAIFGAIVVALAVVLPLAYPHNPYPSYLLGMAGLGALIVVMGALDDLYQFPASVQALFLLAIGLAVQFLNGRIAGPVCRCRRITITIPTLIAASAMLNTGRKNSNSCPPQMGSQDG